MGREFNGVLAALDSASSSLSSPAQWTVAAHVYPDVISSGTTAFIIWNRDELRPGQRHFQFRFYQGNLDVIAFNSAGSPAIASKAASVSVWQHVAGTFDASLDVRAYVNGGTPTTTTTLTGTASTDQWHDTIGAGRHGVTGLQNWFNGKIAWPCLWNVALSDAEIDALANGAHPLTIRPDAIERFYPLTGASSGGEVDIISGVSLTENSTVTSVESPLVALGGAWPANYTPAAGGGFQPAWAARSTITISGGMTR